MEKFIKILFILFSILGTHLCYAAKWDTITIGTQGTYPPFNQSEIDGSLRGFDIDIGNALCTNIQATCNWIIIDHDAIIPSLIAKKIDAIIASVPITKENKVKVNFTQKYYSNPLALVVPMHSELQTNPYTLEGSRIGVVHQTKADDYITAFWQQHNVVIVRFATHEQLHQNLLAQTIDASLQDAITADVQFLRSTEGKQFTFGGSLLFGTNEKEQKIIGDGMGIAIRKENTMLLQKMNKALEDIIKSGQYQQIREKYFAYEIY